MGRFLASAYRADTPSARNALDDYWYTPRGNMSQAGSMVSADTALRVSAAYRCTELIAGSVGQLPLPVYHRLPDGGKEPARDHPMFRLLGSEPNAFQATDVWREQQQARLLLRGNMFSRILPGPAGGYPIGGLLPIPPDRVTVKVAPNGSPVYQVRNLNGTTENLGRDQVWHVPGLALAQNGISGLGIVEAARESLGLALSAATFGARTFSQGIHPSAMLKTQGALSDGAQGRLRENMKLLIGGLNGSHELAILEEGLDLVNYDTLTPADVQFMSVVEFQVRDIARWFGVPPHMIGEINRNTSWGAGIEQMTLGFVMFTLLRWLRRWENAISKDLLYGDDYFAEFNLSGLLRGDTATRWNAYRIGLDTGTLAVNDVRRMENLNPIPGGDVPTIQINRQKLGAVDEQLAEIRAMVERRDGPPAEALSLPSDGNARDMLELFSGDAAQRVVRREIAAIGKAAERHASDGAAWQAAVRDFYAKHSAYVVESLHVSAEEAARYCRDQEQDLIYNGAGVMKDWEGPRVGDLVKLAIGNEDEPAKARSRPVHLESAATDERVEQLAEALAGVTRVQEEMRGELAEVRRPTRTVVERNGQPWLSVTEEPV